MTKQVGKVEEIEFHIYKGKQLAFDVLWWADVQKTIPMNITQANGAIQTMDSADADLIVDLAPTFTANRVVVRLTEAQTLALTEKRGFLEIEATSGTTGPKSIARGRVIIHPEASE